MSEDKAAETLRALRLGKPVYTLETNVITNVVISPKGEATVDFVFGKTAHGQAGVMRLLIAPEAIKILWERLVESQSILDALPSMQSQQSAN